VPTLYSTETAGDSQISVYQKLGPDIQTLFNQNQAKFSSITVAMIFHLAVKKKNCVVLMRNIDFGIGETSF